MYQPYYAPVSPRSRWFAAVLCFLFGWAGIHRFYVGKGGSGLLYLLTGGLFGLGWLYDLFCLLFGWFRDGMGLPLIY
ncbi:MAG: NINE protein [Oscillospiraceae bacterium]|jgi:TM2 domain-containing membrane protein YozV|nr:NINE protein [Oscillospiraceae bacterium]